MYIGVSLVKSRTSIFKNESGTFLRCSIKVPTTPGLLFHYPGGHRIEGDLTYTYLLTIRFLYQQAINIFHWLRVQIICMHPTVLTVFYNAEDKHEDFNYVLYNAEDKVRT